MDEKLLSRTAALCGQADSLLAGRLLSAYVIGSRADGTAVPSSDVDLLLIVDSRQESDTASLARLASREGGPRFDLILRTIGFYQRNGGPSLSAIGRHVYGTDVSSHIGPERFEPYFVRKLLGFVNYQRIIRDTDEVLRYPVRPPDDTRFRGYHVRGLLTQNGFVEGFRTLVNLITQGSTVMVGVRRKIPVYTKKHSIERYMELDHEPYRDFVGDSYELLNRRLHYELPARPADIASVERLCERVPGFENHVLEAVRARFRAWPKLDPEPLRRQMMESFTDPNGAED